MPSAEPLLSYRELIATLRQLCAEGRTGTVFITTSENEAVRFSLRGGTITSAVFRHATGEAALASIKRIGQGRLRYSSDVIERGAQAPLPPTPELLAMLAPVGGDAPERPAPPVVPVVVPPSLERGRAVIEAELSEYLGPMASVVCNEHITRAARNGAAASLNVLIETIAEECGSAAKAERFKERVRARLVNDLESRPS